MAAAPFPPDHERSRDFARQAEGRSYGMIRELLGLLRDNKKWWLTPIILALALVGVLVMLGGTVVAPFIYTLF